MREIISGITCLLQYVNMSREAIERCRPQHCVHCNALTPWHHGHYERKADRENDGSDTLNPIPIYRFYCAHCRRTSSLLPECIPPRRWYLWTVQQIGLLLMLTGQTAYTAAKQVTPTGRTLTRWLLALKKRHLEFQADLKSWRSRLGYYPEFESFWQYILTVAPLSEVMCYLNAMGVIVP